MKWELEIHKKNILIYPQLYMYLHLSIELLLDTET